MAPIHRRALLGSLSLLLLGSRITAHSQARPMLSLSQFLHLSAFLTGFDTLDNEDGQRYLTQLHERPGMALRLRTLYEQLGLASEAPPASLDDLSDEILFAHEENSRLAEEIVTFWCARRYRALSTPWILTSSRANSG